MKYWQCKPEVPGGFGDNTVIDRSSGKPVVRKLHYEFDGWLGDDILTSTPCFIVTERLAQAVERKKLTGVKLDEVEVSKSEEFEHFFPNRELPKFRWLKLEGQPGRDDFALGPGLRLVISERAYTLLKEFQFAHAEVERFES